MAFFKMLLQAVLSGAAAVVFFVTFLFLIFVGFGTMMMQGSAPRSGHCLVLSFPNGIMEEKPDAWDVFLRSAPPQLGDVIQALELAAVDGAIESVLIDLNLWQISPDKTLELERAIQKVRAAGKKVVAHGDRVTNGSYLAGMMADEFYMSPTNSADFSLSGYYMSVPYFGSLAEKAGIQINVLRVGECKSFGENYSHSQMTPEFRSEIMKIKGAALKMFAAKVATARNLPPAQVEGAILRGDWALLGSHGAQQQGLIDGLKYRREILTELKVSDSQDLVAVAAYASGQFDHGEIAVLNLEGSIIDDVGQRVSGYLTPSKVRYAVDEVLADRSIQGVVVRVNSPGGSALASELILEELKRLPSDIPVAVSMGSVAASGGYYISTMADKIFATDYTITGSIGVVAMVPKIETAVTKLGINLERIEAGKLAGLYDWTKNWSEEERNLLEHRLNAVYLEFKERVKAGRGMMESELEPVAQGKVWTGAQAKAVGLVDELGTLQDAVAWVAEEAGLSSTSFRQFPEAGGLFAVKPAHGVSAAMMASLKEQPLFELNHELFWLKAVSGRPLMWSPLGQHFLED